MALLLALGQAPALAATINVSGTCTLVRAIVAANNNTTAGGRCRKGSGADTIVLPNGSTQRLTTVNNTVYGPTGLPVIRSAIIIAGNNSTIRRAAAAPDFRILAIGDPGNLALRRTTITGGRAITDVPDSDTDNTGGGVLNVATGGLTITHSTISGNAARTGGGLGVFDTTYFGSFRDVTVTNSTISANRATGLGGGAYNYQDELILTNTTVSGNTARSAGGVESVGGGDRGQYASILSLTNSTVSGNTATDDCGGIAETYSAGFTEVIKSTISGNTASGNGGGACSIDYGRLILTNSTVSGNTAGGAGGGIRSYSRSEVELTNSTVSRNTAESNGGGLYSYSESFLHLERTLISGNTASSGQEVYNADDTSVISDNFNVLGYRRLTNAQAFENFTPGPTDITATSNGNDPTALVNILNPTLANNGGPTRTHALVGGSPAIDTVTDGTCPPPAKDQRGVSRPQDGNNDGAAICDTGAFERR